MADVVVINHHQANLEVKERTTKAGKTTQRTVITTTVTSEPIAFMLDEAAVARRAAEMLAQRIREQTEAITEVISPAAAKSRRKAEKAFAAGKSWALRRFSGGRTGVTPPLSSNIAFNHSGRLASSIVARLRKETNEFYINYAANRWNPRDWRSISDMQQAFARWVRLVPVLARPADDLGIQRAIRDTFKDVVQKQKMGTDHKAAMSAGKMALEILKAGAQVLAA